MLIIKPLEENKMTKLIKKIKYSGIIQLMTGLHIGGTNAAMNIGGPDRFVVRNPINLKPYIPGSSLKGKLRSLLEISYGEVSINKMGDCKASENPDHHSAKLFGISANKGGHPSRIIVRDCELITEGTNFDNTDLLYTESKTEVSIDRISASSNPRTFERVPAGARFALNFVLNVFDSDNEEELKKDLKKAISLLHNDYLGAQGSRGYGQVKLIIEKIEEIPY